MLVVFVEEGHQRDGHEEEAVVVVEKRMEMAEHADRSVPAAMVLVLGGENFPPCRRLPGETRAPYFRQRFGNFGSMEMRKS